MGKKEALEELLTKLREQLEDLPDDALPCGAIWVAARPATDGVIMGTGIAVVLVPEDFILPVEAVAAALRRHAEGLENAADAQPDSEVH